MADYPQQPTNPGGGGIFWQRTDPSTWYLYNNPPPMPAPTTTTTLPDPSAAYAAPPPTDAAMYGGLSDDAYRVYQQQQAAQGATTGLAAMGVLPDDSRHGQYQDLRGLDQLMRQHIPIEHLYPYIQDLMDRGVLNPGAGGVGLSTSLPWGGPNAPKTQRLIDAYERYNDYLNSGGAPVALKPTTPMPLTGYTINPDGSYSPRYDPSGGTRVLGTLP